MYANVPREASAKANLHVFLTVCRLTTRISHLGRATVHDMTCGFCLLHCRWTNGLFKSTLHRVVNTSGRERYSVAFFFEPNFTTRVECLPCCVTEERPAAYPPTTAGEHLLAKYAQTHAGYDVNQKQQKQLPQQGQ